MPKPEIITLVQQCYNTNAKLVPMLDSDTYYRCPVCDLRIKKEIEELSEHELFILDYLLTKEGGDDTARNIGRAFKEKFGNTGPNINIILNRLRNISFIGDIDIGYEGFGYSLRSDGLTYIGARREKKPK